ncbi:leucine zipper-EF-hand containing transmembrane protein 1 [Capsaspora owczarzaki ATCC 30864]|uniref:Mitochondrial proton/calcium exchanger protein n=1 Tax=Capsaspora owczarzaki (strain ATCC 30864) TaxID=595528 RepID=A0A0D2WQW5_CAPO3|nr:leucine zipper-EF-hand containing transmembrane protein 1 [Capsaspora owczarzaki ATCC 30864]KJE93478.1 leucine zipper-EF-hand containing transmembrane protein 1 [Capsaspora owczarzaki ATCC 30864]|eukprot:XP_004348090.2 leucine zipper-EF-hand containing transmembrane protein 1 [Capsaspora owczarzaki ATCC 30864]
MLAAGSVRRTLLQRTPLGLPTSGSGIVATASLANTVFGSTPASVVPVAPRRPASILAVENSGFMIGTSAALTLPTSAHAFPATHRSGALGARSHGLVTRDPLTRHLNARRAMSSGATPSAPVAAKSGPVPPPPAAPPKPYVKEPDSNVEKAMRLVQSEAAAKAAVQPAAGTTNSVPIVSASDELAATPAGASATESVASASATGDQLATTTGTAVAVPKKPTLWERAKHELIHYWNGFKLLGADIRITARLLRQVSQGHTLTRRERKQLIRTASDMLRLVPFLVFVIVPFMEFALPIFLKLFPNMLPSTFQESNKEEENMRRKLKVKIEMAKFLQQTVEDMAVDSTSKDSKSVEEFAQFFEKIRTTGRGVTNSEILRFSKLFENELTLDNLSRAQLAALCQVINVPTVGTTNFLRFQLKMKLRELRADDLLIEKEGINMLTTPELQAAAHARGMRAIGLTREQLLVQLQQWLDLHIHEEIPASLLLLSRALSISDKVPSAQELEATLRTLPQTMVTEAAVTIAEIKGEKVSNKSKLEVLEAEEVRIKAEKEESAKSRAAEAKQRAEQDKLRAEKERLLKEHEHLIGSLPSDQASTLRKTLQEIDSDEKVTAEELQDIREALAVFSTESGLTTEIQDLAELKEERQEYKEDLEQLRTQTLEKVKENSASARLGARIESMISNLESEIVATEATLTKARATSKVLHTLVDEDRDGKVSRAEIERALSRLKHAPTPERTARIVQQLDIDRDGFISLDEIMHLADLLEEESGNVHVKMDQLSELVTLLNKENQLEDNVEQQERDEKELKSVREKHRKEDADAVAAAAATIGDGTPVLRDNAKELK